MSESLQIAQRAPETSKVEPENPKDSTPAPKEPTQTPKMILLTGILTAITTIAVSFIGIVPNLRRGDVEEVGVLRQKLDSLEKSHNAGTPTGSEENKLSISGTVRTKDGKQVRSGVEVYLLPESNSLLTAKTDDSGKFFKEIPAGKYSIIVRESINGVSGKVLLDEEENEVTMQGAKVNYHIKRR